MIARPLRGTCRPALALLPIVLVCAVHAPAGQEGVAREIPPPRADLLAVPLPPLQDVEPAVAEQIHAAERQVGEAVTTGHPDRELAEGYGRLASIYHVYELFDPAEAAYQNATRLASADVRWVHLLGYLHQQTGNLEAAVERFAAARRRRADNHAASARLAEVYLRLNRLAEARREFEGVLPVYPAFAHSGLGEVALGERRFREAIEHFEAALAKVPAATALHYPLAMAYRGLGRLDDARRHLARRGNGGIVLVDPIVDDLQALVRGERALVIRGSRAYEAGRLEDAAQAFEEAVRANPSSVVARGNLGLTLSRLGDATGAAEQFEAALRLDPDDVTAHASLGIMRARQGRDDEAIVHLQSAFDHLPHDVTIREELVAALLRSGREARAMDVLVEVRSRHPDDERALVSLAILLAHGERYGEAVALLEGGSRRFPERTATTITLARLLATAPDVTVRNGGRALELALLVHASRGLPEDAETVAMALAELGRCGEAIEWMTRAVDQTERARDAAEAARLRGELPKYQAPRCRPPGR